VVARLSVKTKEVVAATALPAKMKGVGCCDWVHISLNLISISLRHFNIFAYTIGCQYKLIGCRENQPKNIRDSQKTVAIS